KGELAVARKRGQKARRRFQIDFQLVAPRRSANQRIVWVEQTVPCPPHQRERAAQVMQKPVAPLRVWPGAQLRELGSQHLAGELHRSRPRGFPLKLLFGAHAGTPRWVRVGDDTNEAARSEWTRLGAGRSQKPFS